MISIYVTTDARSRLAGLMQPLNGWNNVVHVESGQEITPSHIAESPWHIVVADHGMWLPLSWDDSAPPYIFPQPMSLTPASFVGFLNYLSGDYDKALHSLTDQPIIYAEMKEAVAIATGNIGALNTDRRIEPTNLPAANSFETYRLLHNHAIFLHYGLPPGTTPEQIDAAYRQAVALAPSAIYRAFTIRNQAIFTSENQDPDRAIGLLNAALKQVSGQRVEYALRHNLAHIAVNKAEEEQDPLQAVNAKGAVLDLLVWFQTNHKPVQTALLLQDASRAAHIEGAFAEALNYANRAIDLLKEQQLEELLGNAQLGKGRLLLQWAQNGQQQVYVEAANTLVMASGHFSKDHHPAIFADIQQLLGVAWATFPDAGKANSLEFIQKSQAAFEQALAYFQKDTHPAQYGQVNRQYGHAHVRWHKVQGADHLQLAMACFNKVLSVLPAATKPEQRAEALMEILQAVITATDERPGLTVGAVNELVLMVQAAEQLTSQPKVVKQARQHLSHLLKLAKQLSHTKPKQ